MIASYSLDRGETLRLMFFTDVNNMTEIVEKFSKASLHFVNCTVINLELILDAFQILVAANKAVVAKQNNTSITRNLCTELVFNLFISDNITESLLKFGYGSNTNDLLIALFGSGDQPEHLMSEIHGKLEDISVLREKCNLDAIKNTYDIRENQNCTGDLLDLIITKIARKSIQRLNHQGCFFFKYDIFIFNKK